MKAKVKTPNPIYLLIGQDAVRLYESMGFETFVKTWANSAFGLYTIRNDTPLDVILEAMKGNYDYLEIPKEHYDAINKKLNLS